jgi:hypothetical protein
VLDVASPDLDPLASPSLRDRFPQLQRAMDPGLMAGQLGELLLDGTGSAVLGCERPRAHVVDEACRIQYPLQVCSASGELSTLLVLATIFRRAVDAGELHRSCLVPLAARWAPDGEVGSPQPNPTGVIDGLAMAVSVFPISHRLPTLVDLTDERRASAMVVAALPAGAGAGPVTRIELARLGRTTGCVLRYHLGGEGDGAGPSAVLYAKVGSAAMIDDVRVGLEGLAARRLPGQDRSEAGGGTLARTVSGRGPLAGQPWSLAVPTLLGHSAEHQVMLLSPVAGIRPRLASPADVDAMVSMAAFAAATMHNAPIRVGPTRTMAGELAKAAAAVEAIRNDAPVLAGWLTDAIDAAADLGQAAPNQPVGLAHGDFTPSQLLVHQTRVGVLDFDGVCRADPALDLGRFLAYLQVAAAKADLSTGPTLFADLVAVYRSAGGAEVSEATVEVYAQLSLILMAVHSWQRLKAGRVRLVCRVLAQHLVAGTAVVASG